MSNSREKILQRLRADNPATDLPSPPRYLPDFRWSKEEKLDRFQSMLESVHGEVHRVTRDGLQETISRVFFKNEVSKILCSPRITPYFPEQINGVERFHYDQPIEKWKPALFNSIDASITTTKGGIAQTGSLILWPDQEEPRLMSLVPPIHVAIVKASEIYETFAQAIDAQKWQAGMPTNALLISGPSKTADIEQILAYGIHGPKQLVILVLEEE